MGLSASAAQLDCVSTRQDVTLTVQANWVPTQALKGIILTGATVTAEYSEATLVSYKPKNKRFNEMDRFELTSDGWDSTSLVLPKTAKESFTGFYFDLRQTGKGVVSLACSAK